MITYLIWTTIINLLTHSAWCFSNSLTARANTHLVWLWIACNRYADAILRSTDCWRRHMLIISLGYGFLHLLVVVLLLQFVRLCYLVDFANILRNCHRELSSQLLHHLPVTFLADFIRGQSCRVTHLILRLHPVRIILPLHNRCKSLRFVCMTDGIWLYVESAEAFFIEWSKLTFLVDHGWRIAHWSQFDLQNWVVLI